jgi:hypothetical protein
MSDRLVESSRMKKAFETVYNGVLAKGAFPFGYLRYRSATSVNLETVDLLLFLAA